MRLMLGVNEVAFVEVEGGSQLQLACHRDEDDRLYVHLGGLNCDLEGEEPGMYYVTPSPPPAQGRLGVELGEDYEPPEDGMETERRLTP